MPALEIRKSIKKVTGYDCMFPQNPSSEVLDDPQRSSLSLGQGKIGVQQPVSHEIPMTPDPSPSIITTMADLAARLYIKCLINGAVYTEISPTVGDFHVALRHLMYEIDAPDSPLNRGPSVWTIHLAPILSDSDFTLRQLDSLVTKYGQPSTPRSSGFEKSLKEKPSGNDERSQLVVIGVKLIGYKSSLTRFLGNQRFHPPGKIVASQEPDGPQLDKPLDKVDTIATRIEPINEHGSIPLAATFESNETNFWKKFRKELMAEGISNDVWMKYKVTINHTKIIQ